MDHHLIKAGIVSKLKEFNAYIDNELPDYIMVMLANKKTMHQIGNDLQLFLGDDTERFAHWLQSVLTNPDLLKAKEVSPVHVPVSPSAGSKRSVSERDVTPSPPSSPKVLKQEEEEVKEEEEDDEPVMTGVQRIKLPPEPKETRRNIQEPRRSRDQDLRSLIRRRKAETTQEDEVVPSRKGGVSSVVKIPDKPERPKESRGGTSRLLQRAIHDIHGKKDDKSSSSLTTRKRRSSTQSSSVKIPRTQENKQKEEVVQLEGSDFVDEFLNEERGTPAGREEEEEEEETAVEKEEEQEVEEEVEEEVEQEVEVMEEEEDEEEEEAEEEEQDEIVTITENKEAATLAAVRKILPSSQDNNTDLRLLLNKGKKSKKLTNKETSSSTRFVVTMEGIKRTGDQNQNEEEEEEEEEEESVIQGKVGVGGGLNERCRFWPNCKNGDSCSFHHPTVPCRLFPNCKYGQKCCFVHPVCKFDGRCMKPACPYLHTVPKIKMGQSRLPVVPYRIPPPLPVMYGPGMVFGGGGAGGGGSWSSKNKYPNKQSLKWTPTKPINDRKFAVSDSETTSMPVQ